MWPNDTVKTVFGFCLIIIQFFIPLIVLIVCYSKIVWVLTRRINTDLMKSHCDVNNSKTVSNSVGNAKIVTQIADPGKDKFQLVEETQLKLYSLLDFVSLSVGHRIK